MPETDIGFLLDVLGSALDVSVSRDSVVGAFAGLRPAPGHHDVGHRDAGTGRTADISRKHAVVTSTQGVVTVVGGKLTTYRRMAQDAVDAAVTGSGLTADRCRTTSIPLVGAARPGTLATLAAPRRLVRRYGSEAPAVHALGLADPSLALPVVPGHPVTGAELLWAVRHEGALDESDILDRRTRIGLVPHDREAACEAARDALAR